MSTLEPQITASTSQASLVLNQTSYQSCSNPTVRPSSIQVLRPADTMICSLDQLANPPVGQQPNYPWWTIIRAAIMGSQYGILNRQEIYEALENRWQYFRTTDHQTTRVWKSAIGHNLSVKECFVRVHVEGGRNVSYYIVDTAVDPAKGRLSKAKNVSHTDRMPIPTISRKVVLPPNFDLSIRARWSPTIAAIRNAKYGLPCHCAKISRSRQLANSDNSQRHSQSEGSSESEDGTETEGDQVGPIYPSGSRLGSSLSAIIHPNSPRRLQSIPRLAFSRSLSNALVAPTTQPSRRRNTNSQRSKTTRASKQAPVIHSPIHVNPDLSQISRPPIEPLTFSTRTQESSTIGLSPPSDQLHLEGTSLQDQVNAALADVAAKLPEIADRPDEIDDQSMMIDMDSSIFDALPEIDVGAIFKEAQAAVIQEESQDQDHNQREVETLLADEEPGSSLLPTTADFDRLLASVIPDFQTSNEFNHPQDDETRSNQEENLEETNLSFNVEKETLDPEAGLEDLLQHLIDEATNTEAQQQSNYHQGVEESDGRLDQSYLALDQEGDNQGECSTDALMEASRMLEKEIEEAIKLAEGQEMLRAEAEKEEPRQMTCAEQVSSSLNPQLTPSGDIPVHPLPLVEPTSLPSDHQPVIPVSAGGRPKPKPTSRSRTATKDKPTKAVDSSHQQVNKRSAIRPSLLSCLPEPITTCSTSSIVDRRTRASGARTLGRKLNLPLPSSHTTPSQNLFDSSLGTVGDVDDGSSLAPKFLESIETVTLNRPNSTFPELAKEALLAHPDGKLTAAEIFKVLEKKYPYFITAPDSWKATLRNVLTSHSCFVKIPRPIDAPGRGDWWSTVDLPLWKRRRTTAKAKQDEDFIGRYAREQIRKTHKNHINLNSTNLNSNNNSNSNINLNTNFNNHNHNNNVDENQSQSNPSLIQC